MPRQIVSTMFFLLATCHVNSESLPVENAFVSAPPHVPPAITRDHPAKVIVRMETVEKVMSMADGVDYMFWTFDGTVPGSFSSRLQ